MHHGDNFRLFGYWYRILVGQLKRQSKQRLRSIRVLFASTSKSYTFNVFNVGMPKVLLYILRPFLYRHLWNQSVVPKVFDRKNFVLKTIFYWISASKRTRTYNSSSRRGKNYLGVTRVTIPNTSRLSLRNDFEFWFRPTYIRRHYTKFNRKQFSFSIINRIQSTPQTHRREIPHKIRLNWHLVPYMYSIKSCVSPLCSHGFAWKLNHMQGPFPHMFSPHCTSTIATRRTWTRRVPAYLITAHKS